MRVNFYDTAEDGLLEFAVIVAQTDEGNVFCRHRQRDTWEIPGGHREPGEQILETAKRELYEETGAIDYILEPIGVYSVIHEEEPGAGESFGMLYYADIKTFEGELHNEIQQIMITKKWPERWTYPLIQPELLKEAARKGFIKEF